MGERLSMGTRWRLGIVALALGSLVVGCGDDAPTTSAVRGGLEAGAGGGGGGAAVATTRRAKGEAVQAATGRSNESWDKLKVHFLGLENDPSTGFVRNTIGTVRDPFEPMLVKFVPRIVIQKKKTEEVEEELDLPEIENTPVPVAVGPTQRYPATDYGLVLIRWGTSVNKALISDPEGKTFIITKDMKLGNNNGRVTDITRYDVTVKEDNRDEPIILSIQPRILRISEQERPTERLFTNAYQ